MSEYVRGFGLQILVSGAVPNSGRFERVRGVFRKVPEAFARPARKFGDCRRFQMGRRKL